MEAARTEASNNTSVADEFLALSQRVLCEVTASFYELAHLEMRFLGSTIPKVRRIELSMAASVGFVGDSIRGSLTIAPPPELLFESNPVDRALAHSESAAKDWLGETANQILGRFKNKLVPYDITLFCDMPLLVAGSIRMGGARRVVRELNFDIGGFVFPMWWDIQVDEDLILCTSGELARAEGELQLF